MRRLRSLMLFLSVYCTVSAVLELFQYFWEWYDYPQAPWAYIAIYLLVGVPCYFLNKAMRPDIAVDERIPDIRRFQTAIAVWATVLGGMTIVLIFTVFKPRDNDFYFAMIVPILEAIILGSLSHYTANQAIEALHLIALNTNNP